MGLLGVTVPEELGGLGKGYLDHLIVMEEVRRSCSDVRASSWKKLTKEGHLGR